MTAPELMDVHPTDETLAAFLDDRLNKTQRRAVIEHLAECGECRTFVNDVSELKAMDEAEGNVVPMPKRGSGWRAAVASLAVAAGLAVVFSVPIRGWLFGTSVEELTTIAATAENRPTEARLSIDVPYKAAKGVKRGEAEQIVEGVPTDVYRALMRLHAAKRPDPHALGLAHLIAKQYDQAIPYLREAAKTNEEAKIDLAAALLAHGRPADLTEALELSRESNPKALWNRAVALGYLHRDQEAIAAWEAYLKADPESEWATEAKRKIEYLKYYATSAPSPPSPAAPCS